MDLTTTAYLFEEITLLLSLSNYKIVHVQGEYVVCCLFEWK
jgi:hypothetical protein